MHSLQPVIADTSSVFDIPKGRSPNLRAKMVRRINEMNVQHHQINGTYKKILRALINVMNSLQYINSEGKVIDVKAFHGRQERAIAKKLAKETMRLPVVAISQIGTSNDEDRRRYESNLIHDIVWNEDTQRATRVISLAPRAVAINYKLSIWAKYIEDADQLVEQIRLFYNPSLELATEDSTLIKSFIEDESDDSDYVAGDGADRIVRKSISVRVETFIPSPKYLVTSTGEIEVLNLDFCVY